MIENTIRTIVREEIEQAVARVLTQISKVSPATDEARFLNQKQAAAFAGVSKSTIQEWIASGCLRANRIGRLIRIRPADLEAAVSAPSGPAAVTVENEVLRILGSK